ncbi:Uncharacterized protein HA466_0152420 [Hirschfeldia incana]|nr:Uncharacterized protein HA466_0152420 [Hirschfeldia incana]KAJ0249800.1 Uncharacterized protein HA466_0152420 [Hirschfeldia incana]
MNHCNLLQQNSLESRGFAVPQVSSSSLVCPKPRRVGILSNNIIRPSFRLLHSSSQSGAAADVCDSKAGADLLDIIRRKEETLSSVVASSPPFFLGSPPRRVSNPLAQDARFGDNKLSPISPLIPSPPRVRGGGYGLVKFGIKPAAVRVEGFDCLIRDCQTSSIHAMA